MEEPTAVEPKPPHPLRGLLIAQALGAFNDNAWKMIFVVIATNAIEASLQTNSGPDFEAAAQARTTLSMVIFTLPLMLISLPAGSLCDRVSKRSVIIGTKLLEVCLMLAGALALYWDPSNQTVMLVILGLMGLQSGLFSPAKYGILPELTPHERLSAANGLMEMCTFFAIIAGLGLGGPLYQTANDRDRPWLAGAALLCLAVAGFWASLFIPATTPARAEGSLGQTIRSAWTAIRSDRVLWLAVLGQTLFWSIAALLQQNLLVFGKTTLNLSPTWVGAPAAILAIGTGLGSVLAGRWSASKVEYGLLPLGALGLTAATLAVGLFSQGGPESYFLFALMGIASGFLLIPLNAILQWRSPNDSRGAVIALTNVLAFAGILVGSMAAGALSLRLSSQQIFTVSSAAVAIGALWALRLVPDAFVRFVLLILTHTFYRLRVVGRVNVPATGGALLVPNHVSFVDGLMLLGSTDRPIRFLVYAAYVQHWLMGPFLRALGAIPVSASGGPKSILRALRDAGACLDNGELVCIFPEGQLTRTGMLQPFSRGMERIVKGRNVPIIPVHLDRIWGSIFSRAGGRYLTKIPERLPFPVTVSFGTPLPSGSTIGQVRRAVLELEAAAWEYRKGDRRPLGHSFVAMARRRPFRMALADASRPCVRRWKALVGAIGLARALRPQWQDQQMVGILLPCSVPAALVNLAATLAGKAAVNLNFTTGPAGMESAAKQAGLRTVVTSQLFLQKAKVELPANLQPLWIEDIVAGIGWKERACAMALALLAPIRWLERACGATRLSTVDDIATVIFSSGSTGEPKGVLLTHFNIDANVEAAAQVMGTRADDRMVGILPLFHSFGYFSLWFASLKGIGIVYHPSPLDANAIGELIETHSATILLATPTFLQLYLRRCTPAQFGSLRLILVGAEKLSERLSQSVEDYFGIRPLEGYGLTECSPVVAVSSTDYRGPGIFQPGSRRGFVGQPLPGVLVQTVDPDTFEPLGPDQPGMLLVKGPNVMRGYLGRDDLTASALRDGWYVTGDIALIDADGFVKITGRLSRFSKIGGEMVPHGRVEDALQEAASADIQVFAVTGVGDEKKGERLIVLHTLDESRIPAILERLSTMGLPNLFIPKRDQFLHIDRLPLLGTGKLDLREIKRLATTAQQQATSTPLEAPA